MKRIGELSPTLFADRQARRGLAPPWENGKNGKEFRSTMGSKAVVGIFSVGIEEPNRWKDSVQNREEIRLWAIEGIANDLRPWFTKFSGTLHDKRWLPVVEELYTWHWRNQEYLRNTRSLARAGMVYSQQTGHFYGGSNAAEKVENHTLGYYQALIESRIPFQMVHEGLLDEAQLEPYKVLILPNIAALSDQQCEQLRAFVKRGGGLVATYETSLYDDWGMRRKDFGLADLFGTSYGGSVEPRMQNSYLTLETDPATGRRHPILAGLEAAERIINGASRVVTKPGPVDRGAPLTLIPSYPDLPMEEVYARTPHTDIAEVFVREYGAGRVVYFPWDIDRVFWQALSTDHLKLLRNAVEWAANEPPPVAVKGAGVMDVTIFRQKASLTVHLVNLTNPMMMKGPVREFIASPPQEVTIRLPKGSQVRAVKLLVSRRAPAIRRAGDLLTVAVSSVLDHEVVAIDL
jgi:hypothetical protein